MYNQILRKMYLPHVWYVYNTNYNVTHEWPLLEFGTISLSLRGVLDQFCIRTCTVQVYVNKMSLYSNSNYLSSTVSIVQ